MPNPCPEPECFRLSCGPLTHSTSCPEAGCDKVEFVGPIECITPLDEVHCLVFYDGGLVCQFANACAEIFGCAPCAEASAGPAPPDTVAPRPGMPGRPPCDMPPAPPALRSGRWIKEEVAPEVFQRRIFWSDGSTLVMPFPCGTPTCAKETPPDVVVPTLPVVVPSRVYLLPPVSLGGPFTDPSPGRGRGCRDDDGGGFCGIPVLGILCDIGQFFLDLFQGIVSFVWGVIRMVVGALAGVFGWAGCRLGWRWACGAERWGWDTAKDGAKETLQGLLGILVTAVVLLRAVWDDVLYWVWGWACEIGDDAKACRRFWGGAFWFVLGAALIALGIALAPGAGIIVGILAGILLGTGAVVVGGATWNAVAGPEHVELPECARAFLQEIFGDHVDVGRVDFYLGLPFAQLRDGSGGFAWGTNVYIDPGSCDPRRPCSCFCLGLIAHELFHVAQSGGEWGWYEEYLREMIRHGRGEDNAFEQPADDFEEALRNCCDMFSADPADGGPCDCSMGASPPAARAGFTVPAVFARCADVEPAAREGAACP